MLFCAFCVYNFSNFAFFFIEDTYYNGDIGDNGGERTCSTLMQCFFTTLNYGPRHDPAIGYHLVAMSYTPNNMYRYRFRFFYDLLYKVGIKIVILQIIFGIIIDTFADLRTEKNKVIKDLASKCYICSIDKQKFERNADGFINHYRRDHRIWNYMFYLKKLSRKD